MHVKTFFIGCLLLFSIQAASGQLIPDFSADLTVGCAPILVKFNDLSKGNITNRKWDLGNGTIVGNTTQPSTTYLSAGVFTVKLTIYNGTDSSVITKENFITVSAIPVIHFTATPLSGCLPVNVQLKDSSKPGTAGAANYQWDFGDGFLGTGQNPQHIYNSPGRFKVTLTLKNSLGCVSSASRLNYITVFDAVNANFDIQPPATCLLPATYKFTNSSTGIGIDNYLWDFGDGQTSSQINPSHVYAIKGSYTVKLVIHTVNGCTDTLTKLRAISPGNNKANFTIPATGCIGEPVDFINTSAPPNLIDSIRWQFGDGITATTLHGITTYFTAGSYKVKLITWFGACSDSVEKTINIVAKPVPLFTATPASGCKPPLKVQFNNVTFVGTIVQWKFGDGATSTLANPVYTYNNSGSFDVSMVVKNANGCMDTLIKKNYININPPVINAVNGLPFKGCVPFSSNFLLDVTSPEAIVKYEWNFGDGSTSSSKNPLHDFTDTSLYNISAVITTSSGCTDTITSTVHGGKKPVAKFKGAPTTICPLDPVNFENLSSDFSNTWHWEFGDGGTSEEQNPSYLYKDTGFMTVTLIAFNNGCADTSFIKNYVYVNPPIARFLDSSVCSDPFTIYLMDNSKGGNYWKWYLTPSDSIEAKNTVFTFPDTGSYNVKLYIRDSLCENSASRDILILNEKAAFTVVDSPICGVSYKKFIAGGPRTHATYIVKYFWDFGDGEILESDTSIITHEYNKSGPVTVRLIIKDIHGCCDTTELLLNIKLYGPVADFTPSVNHICAGTLLIFTDASVYDSLIPIVKWKWNFGNGNDTTFTKAPFNVVYNLPGVYDVVLTVQDSLGCSKVVVKQNAVVVYKPLANFSSADTLICINSPVNFTNLSTGTLIQSLWNFGDGSTSTATVPSKSYGSVGNYDITLVISDSLNCRDSITKLSYISVKEAKSDFSISDSFTTCPPLVVMFTNKSVNHPLNNWNFDNGNTSTLINPTHTYTTPGTFFAKLVVTGNGGCSDSVVHKIEIEGPRGTFSYGPQLGCPPLSVKFQSAAQNTKAITWDFSDGELNVNENLSVSHMYSLPGIYVPRVILSDGVGCKLPVQGADTIRVIGAKALIASLPVYTFCDSATVQFFDSTITTDVIKSYQWNFGDGTLSNSRNPVHAYLTAGKYKVSFKVETIIGCKSADTLSETIVVAKTPKGIIIPQLPVCLPAAIQFNANWQNNDTSQVTWRWNFGNGQSSDLFKPAIVNYNVAGKYTIQLIASNRYNCADTTQKIFAVNDTPKVIVGPPGIVCIGSKITLSASGGTSYRWDNNNTLSCINCQNPVASPLNEQIYRATATDSNGCKASDTVLIKVQFPEVLKTGLGDTLCLGEKAELQASGTDVYFWSPPSGLSSTTKPNPVATPLVTTNYRVIGSDSAGCFRDTGFVPITVFPIPVFNIIEDKITALTGTVLNIATTSSADVIRWHWSPPFGLSCTKCAIPNVTIGSSLTYTATAINAGMCKATDRVTIVPVCNADNVYIPNTFSPNGDGYNDVFYPRGKGVSLIKSMRIFNRWGEMVYEHKDFALNDPGAGWNGKYRGAALSPDVYVYLVDVLCDNSFQFTVKGNLTLLK